MERIETALASAVRGTFLAEYVAPERAVRIAEFGGVGATGALVNLLVLLALADGDGILVPALAAFVAGVLWTYGLNRLVTFDFDGGALERAPHYVGVYAVGYTIYAVFLTIGLALALPAWLSGLAATGVGGVWNYWGSERIA
ncbi:GtrA family protein [Salarchaeum sp. JOR-1]|uniref:GtrA family protein n=1 Tax=Salarchaeum sp. JOR-1 TaxID=2599399 RepID=UPI0011983025|nr:GtrA family protein [Salarchaeum sp. JOR-1]QDX39872.1 hypothetical protein FQU85_02775 [Salarchaeum sp. JOR-1]